VSLKLPIALDAMGGDKAPASVVHGAKLALKQHPGLHFLFYGDEAKLAPLIHKIKPLRDVSTIIHTEVAVGMHEKPSVALRQLRTSSMRLAINAVSKGEASAVVSGGNTGALMMMAKFVFKTLKGIERPAITAFMPAQQRDVAMLDMGANVDCTAEHLVQFAIMGDAYARVVLGVERPKVALLNVGAEDMKGHEVVQSAHQLIKALDLPINYVGFVEGNDILEGTVDVVVTDGFTGNIALKTAEGAARLIYNSIRTAIESSFTAKIGYLLAKPALTMALRKFDPRAHNGAILLGLNGIAVKSHGGTDAKGFSNAIMVAVKLVEQDINNKIIEELGQTAKTTSQVAPLVAMPSVAPESMM
jgi:glycerol-3-phosphate acyltransferase PlsX